MYRLTDFLRFTVSQRTHEDETFMREKPHYALKTIENN